MNNDNLIWSRANVCYTRIEKITLVKGLLLDYTAEILKATEDVCGDLYYAEFCADSESDLKFDLGGRSKELRGFLCLLLWK